MRHLMKFSTRSGVTRSLLASTMCLAIFLLSSSNGVQAGVIPSVGGAVMFGPNAGTGPGLGTVVVPAIFTPSVNNDNVAPPSPLDNNIVVPIKRFDFPGFIDIVFNVLPSSGVTEYAAYESVDNNTGSDWYRYHMVLGFGFGPGFVPSGPGDGLDFDLGPPAGNDSPPSSSVMPIVIRPTADELVFLGGVHSTGAESYQFRIDVPDFPVPPGPGPGPTFTIRQFPILVPEPSAFVLSILFACGGLVMGRQRR